VTLLPHGGYEHPSLKLMTLGVNDWPRSVRGGCGESSNSGKGDISLHNFDKYELLTKDDEDIGSSSIFAKLVQETNRGSPVESAYFGGSWQMRGWNFLGSDMKSDEIVHLVQNDASHECILSFGQEEADKYPELPSGSSTSFCNLPAKVHSGFRDQLLASLSSDDYLANIKPKLSHCATIAVTGHSKGGAIATLFAACANNGAIAGGNKDFELLDWWTYRPAARHSRCIVPNLSKGSNSSVGNEELRAAAATFFNVSISEDQSLWTNNAMTPYLGSTFRLTSVAIDTYNSFNRAIEYLVTNMIVKWRMDAGPCGSFASMHETMIGSESGGESFISGFVSRSSWIENGYKHRGPGTKHENDDWGLMTVTEATETRLVVKYWSYMKDHLTLTFEL